MQFPGHDDLIYVGALLFHRRVPWAGDANVVQWLNTLNGIARSKPKRLVTLTGPLADARALILDRDSLLWIQSQIREAMIEQVERERIPQRVLDSPKLSTYFDPRPSRSELTELIVQILEETGTGRGQD